MPKSGRAQHRSPDTVATGRMGASWSAVGLLHPDVAEALADFHRLNTDEARAAFADRWLRRASRRLEEAWPVIYFLLRLMREEELYNRPGYLEQDQVFPDFKSYFEATMKLPISTWAELEGTYRFVQDYAPELWGAAYSKARLESLRKLEEFDQETRRPVGTNQHSGGVDIVNTLGRPEGNSRQYALRRLRGPRPDLHSRVIAGELTPHAAMLEAGFRRRTLSVEPMPAALDRFVRRHLTEQQISELVRLLTEAS